MVVLHFNLAIQNSNFQIYLEGEYKDNISEKEDVEIEMLHIFNKKLSRLRVKDILARWGPNLDIV